ncbi:MAG: GatB/YqeY domain-containing protein [Clostridia bacterium]|nr:GatB/YqeY domain-containing protein [Clostridia bacterium]
MTLEEFKKVKIEAMKARNSAAVSAYNAIISKLMLLKTEKVGTELTEQDSINVVKKVEKELIEEKEGYLKGGREESAKEIDLQLEVVKQYLPKLLSQEEIKQEILKLEDKSIPSVMKHFKINFAGKVDMKLVQETLKSL